MAEAPATTDAPPILKPCPECWAKNRVRPDYHDHACTTGQIPTCGACGCDLFNYGPEFHVFLDAARAAASGRKPSEGLVPTEPYFPASTCACGGSTATPAAPSTTTASTRAMAR